MRASKPEITVAAITESDGRFLVVEERINQRLVFNQPAGHVEHGESLLNAVVREVREDVRDTVRSLREELTRAAREMRGADVAQRREAVAEPCRGAIRARIGAAVEWLVACADPIARPANDGVRCQAGTRDDAWRTEEALTRRHPRA